MAKLKWLIAGVSLLALTACNFDARHNEKHRHEWAQALTDIHEDLDYFFLEPK